MRSPVLGAFRTMQTTLMHRLIRHCGRWKPWRAHLDKRGSEGLKIRFCLCERRARASDELRRYADQKEHFEIHVFHGSFENHLGNIASACGDGFTFTFIDPTGWNIRSEPVFEFLREQKGEFLINFMAEHVNRHAEFPKVAASFGRFLADPGWGKTTSTLYPSAGAMRSG